MKTVTKKKKKNSSFHISTIIEMLFSLLMIPLGLAAAKGLEGTQNTEELLAFLMLAEFLLLAVTTFLRATARRYRNQIQERRKLDFIFSGLFLACAVAIFIEPSLTVMMIAGIVFMLSLIPSRVFVIVVMLLIAFRSLLRIMSVTFARLRLDLLRDIVQKTYAAEIIFGLLLLIASFSFVLLYTDAASFDGKYTNALWYCFAVVTTIGFGDMTAVSSIGRVLSVILGIYGIIVVALITSIIVNFYGEMKKVRAEEAEALPEEADPSSEAGQETEGDTKQAGEI